MKAKYIKFLPLILLFSLTVLALSACGHQHVPTGWIMDPPATCTSVGHRYQKCLDCDEILEEEDYTTKHSYDNGLCVYCGRPQYNEEYLKYERITIDGQEGYTVAGIGNCHSVDLVIPEKYKSLPVLAISDNALANAVRIESVTVPKTVQSIGARAFYDCKLLKTVRFANGSACTSIGAFAFAECPLLRTAELPDGLTEIPEGLFSGCVKLKTLTVPAVSYVGYDAFGGCDELQKNERGGLLYLGPAANPYLILVGVTDRTVTAITIGEDTRLIAPGALAGCTKLSALTLPQSITLIGCYAFSGCSSLSSIRIPDEVTIVDDYAFQDCTALAEITLPDGLLRIGTGAFFNCRALTSLTLPATLTAVGITAFYGCEALTFATHGTGRYLGTADNPYFLLCGYATAAHTDALHPDHKLVADQADITIIP